MDKAVEQVFPCSKDKQNKFLKDMIDMAGPVNLDYPKDKGLADNGKRMENIRKLNGACKSLINVVKC